MCVGNGDQGQDSGCGCRRQQAGGPRTCRRQQAGGPRTSGLHWGWGSGDHQDLVLDLSFRHCRTTAGALRRGSGTGTESSITLANRTRTLTRRRQARLLSTGSSIGTIAVSWIFCRPSPALLGGFIASCCAPLRALVSSAYSNKHHHHHQISNSIEHHTYSVSRSHSWGISRLLSLLADNKTKLHFRALDEAIDVDSEAYCWRRSGFFWRMRASLGLAYAQATTRLLGYRTS